MFGKFILIDFATVLPTLSVKVEDGLTLWDYFLPVIQQAIVPVLLLACFHSLKNETHLLYPDLFNIMKNVSISTLQGSVLQGDF